MKKPDFQSIKTDLGLIKNEIDRIIPISSPGRGKRKQRSLIGNAAFVAAAHAFETGKPDTDLLEIIADAFRDNDASVFKAILEAHDVANNAAQSVFSRTVILARECKVILAERLKKNPTKAELRAEIIKRFPQTFGKADLPRWREVWREAGLGWLPNGRAEAKASKHGEHTKTKREKLPRLR